MAPVTPPAFEEAVQCAVCGCSFGTFRRRHHCRSCGRSFCNEHSSNQMALPHFGLHTPARVCKDCFTGEKQVENNISNIQSPSPEASETNHIESSTNLFADLHLNEDTKPPHTSTQGIQNIPSGFECKCGMPLCICTPEPPKETLPSTVVPTASTSNKSKRVSASPASKPSQNTSTTHLPSLFFQSGQTHGNNQASTQSYPVSGEGMREAIKNGDVGGVKNLLDKGVDANYMDKQGMSLLHLAAVFNFTEIAFMLMDAGADVHAKNSQGETPLDCAQTTLQYKIRQKLQGS